MVSLTASVGFSDRDLATPHNPSGRQTPGVPFDAPADLAKRLVDEGLAERTEKAAAESKAKPSKAANAKPDQQPPSTPDAPPPVDA